MACWDPNWNCARLTVVPGVLAGGEQSNNTRTSSIASKIRTSNTNGENDEKKEK